MGVMDCIGIALCLFPVGCVVFLKYYLDLPWIPDKEN